MTISKPLLMPVLIWHVAASLAGNRASAMGRLLIVALTFSWLGDITLMNRGDVWFMLGLGFFFIAQVSYARAFWADGMAGPLRAKPAQALPWVAWWVVLLVVLLPHLGGLLVPVAIYGVVLVGMAALATGVNRVTAVGAALFVISDSLLALSQFTDVDLPAHSFIVMLTYIAGQGLIAVGVIHRLQHH